MAEVFAPFVRKGHILGENIFVYNNIITNQVIYSLTKNPEPKQAIKQLTFVGKKSVPSSFRKDCWLPLARVSFQQPTQGLRAYRTLREFRKRHEHEWPRPTSWKNENPNITPRRQRTLLLMNQKANSIADIAATLHIQSQTAKKSSRKGRSEGSLQSGVRNTSKSSWPKIESMEGVTIAWTNIEDATYAKDWPMDVKHYPLENKGGLRISPAPSKLEAPDYADNAVLRPQKGDGEAKSTSQNSEEIQATNRQIQPALGRLTSWLKQ